MHCADGRVHFFGNANLKLDMPQSSFMCMLLLKMSRLLVYPVISTLSILSAALSAFTCRRTDEWDLWSRGFRKYDLITLIPLFFFFFLTVSSSIRPDNFFPN